MYWYWSLVALLLAVFLIGTVGLLARNYFGHKIIEWVDTALLRIPLLNKIYSATKQVNDAFSATNKSAFRTVVLVEFPHAGAYSIGFITSDQQEEVQAKTGLKVVCVFVPATPNPTSGFLLMVPQPERTISCPSPPQKTNRPNPDRRRREIPPRQTPRRWPPTPQLLGPPGTTARGTSPPTRRRRRLPLRLAGRATRRRPNPRRVAANAHPVRPATRADIDSSHPDLRHALPTHRALRPPRPAPSNPHPKSR